METVIYSVAARKSVIYCSDCCLDRADNCNDPPKKPCGEKREAFNENSLAILLMNRKLPVGTCCLGETPFRQ